MIEDDKFDVLKLMIMPQPQTSTGTRPTKTKPAELSTGAKTIKIVLRESRPAKQAYTDKQSS
jgi:hypothetical protein